MLTNIKLSKAQLSNINQSGGFLGNVMINLGKKELTDLPVLLDKNVLPKLEAKGTSSILDIFGRKISGQGAFRARKGFILCILNEDIDEITKIVESLENSGILIDGASETVKYETKRQEGGFFPATITPVAASLVAPMASSLINNVLKVYDDMKEEIKYSNNK